MGKCIVPGCPHSSSLKYSTKISYHICKEEWVQLIETATRTKIKWSKKNAKICFVHFEEIHKDVDLKGRNILNEGAEPSLFGDSCPRYKHIKQENSKKKKNSSSVELKKKMANPMQQHIMPVQSTSSKEVTVPLENATTFVQNIPTKENDGATQNRLQKKTQFELPEAEEESSDEGFMACSDVVVTSLMDMIIKLMYNAECPQNTELLSNLLDLPENQETVSELLCRCKEEIIKSHAKMYNIFARKFQISHEHLATMKDLMESYFEELKKLWKKVPGIEDNIGNRPNLLDTSTWTSDESLEGCMEEDSKTLSVTMSLCTQKIMEYHAKMINCFKKQKLAPEDLDSFETPSMLIEVYFTVINELWQKSPSTVKHIKAIINEAQVKILPARRFELNIPATLREPDGANASLDTHDYVEEIEVPAQLEAETTIQISPELKEEQSAEQRIEDGISVLIGICDETPLNQLTDCLTWEPTSNPRKRTRSQPNDEEDDTPEETKFLKVDSPFDFGEIDINNDDFLPFEESQVDILSMIPIYLEMESG